MTNGRDFSGKVAIITGGTSGIGLALAQALASRGGRVIAASSDPAKVDHARAALARSGGEARQLDVRDRAAFRALVDSVPALSAVSTTCSTTPASRCSARPAITPTKSGTICSM